VDNDLNTKSGRSKQFELSWIGIVLITIGGTLLIILLMYLVVVSNMKAKKQPYTVYYSLEDLKANIPKHLILPNEDVFQYDGGSVYKTGFRFEDFAYYGIRSIKEYEGVQLYSYVKGAIDSIVNLDDGGITTKHRGVELTKVYKLHEDNNDINTYSTQHLITYYFALEDAYYEVYGIFYIDKVELSNEEINGLLFDLDNWLIAIYQSMINQNPCR